MKAILITDMPIQCTDCKFSEPGASPTSSWRCTIENKQMDWNWNENWGEKPNWCPLKPVPEKAETPFGISNSYSGGVIEGWNFCIDEILEEKK